MPTWLEAGLWGLLGGGALVAAAPSSPGSRACRGTSWPTVMAFGAGVLISAVAFDLMEEADAHRRAPRDGDRLPRRRRSIYLGGQRSCSTGTAPDTRKRSGRQAAVGAGAGRQRHGDRGRARSSTGSRSPSSSGLGLLGGGAVSLTVLAAVFISNVPEGLSSAAGMKRSGRSATIRLRRLGRHRGDQRPGRRWSATLRLRRRPAGGRSRVDHRGGGRRHPDDDRRHDDPRGLRAHPDVDRGHHHASASCSPSRSTCSATDAQGRARTTGGTSSGPASTGRGASTGWARTARTATSSSAPSPSSSASSRSQSYVQREVRPTG